MSATFYERLMRIGDYENDGGIVDVEGFQNCLALYEAGDYSASQIKSYFSCTAEQEEDVDDILGTLPGTLLSFLQTAARARWALHIGAVFRGSLMALSGFSTEAECKAAIGL